MSTITRVLWLGLEYPPITGGDAVMSEALCSEFARCPELEIHVITSAVGERVEVQQQSANVTIHRVPLGYPATRLRHLNTLESLVYLVRARNYARELRSTTPFTLCHAIGTIPCGFLAYRWRQSMPYVISIRGWDVPGFNERFSGFYSLVKTTVQEIWKHAYTIVATSSDLEDLAHRTERGCAMRVIPDGVDLTRFFVPRITTDSTFRVLFSGGLFERKGIEFLVDAVAKLFPRFPQLRLIIAGSGDRCGVIEERVHQQHLESVVTFLGEVPNEKMPQVYANADVFVLPSFIEGLSFSLLEAMASGLPIISTSTGGARNWIVQNGTIVAMRDAASIARAIESYITHPKRVEEYGKKSREIAEQFAWTRIAERYRSLYQEIARSQ